MHLDDALAASPGSSVGVAILGELIAWVGRLEEIPAEFASLPRTHHEGATLMPGLIDAHVHMEFDPRYALHAQPALTEEQRLGALRRRAAVRREDKREKLQASKGNFVSADHGTVLSDTCTILYEVGVAKYYVVIVY